MAINKPSKPSATLPQDFGGVQTPYTSAQISSGYQDGIPQVVDGGNMNYERKGLFQGMKYLRTVVDFIRDTPIGKIFWINSNGQMDYMTPAVIATDTEYTTGTATDKTPNVKQVVDKFATKQDKLTSGTNIKTVNSTSLLGSGNISVQATITGGATTITSSNLTSGRVLISDSSGKVAASVITTTELGYLDDVTSNVQTQLNTKAADSDVVKLTGNQSITGQKAFSNLRISSVGGEGGQVSWEPANTTNASSIETDVVASSSSVCCYRIFCQGGTLGAKVFLFDFISGNMTLPSNPAAASNTTVSATTAWVRTLLNGAEIVASGNNYFKLKNGVIIQWGQCGAGDSVVFPLPYTSLPCVQLTTYVTTQSQNNRSASVTELTTTGFVPRSEASWRICWFAIGK